MEKQIAIEIPFYSRENRKYIKIRNLITTADCRNATNEVSL